MNDWEKEARGLVGTIDFSPESDQTEEQIIALAAEALRRAHTEGQIEAYEDAIEDSDCECSTAAPVWCSLCEHGQDLKKKAAALRRGEHD